MCIELFGIDADQIRKNVDATNGYYGGRDYFAVRILTRMKHTNSLLRELMWFSLEEPKIRGVSLQRIQIPSTGV